MFSIDITPPVKIVPGIASWGRTVTELPITGQDITNIENLRDLEHEFGVKIHLDPVDVYNNKWSTDLLQNIYSASYPLKEIFTLDTTVKVTREWLMYWELYSQYLVDYFTNRIKNKEKFMIGKAKARAAENKIEYKEKPISKLGINIHSFHSRDNSGASVSALQKAINHVEFNTNAQIGFDWFSTYTANTTESEIIEIEKNKSKWNGGVDNNGEFSVTNMRVWKNKITTTLKTADVIIANAKTENDITLCIAFVLMNIAPNGIAFVRLPKLSTTATASMIHLFSQCFEKSEIIHTVAMDRLYLCGENFLGNILSRHCKFLYEFCEIYTSVNISPFIQQHVSGENFLYTVDKLIEVNTAIYKWRYDYYEKLLYNYSKLHKSASAMTFDDYINTVLERSYPDESKKWIDKTNFNFFHNLE